jgi:hypothetical protein
VLKGKGFQILIASPPDYEQVIAEIYYDGLVVAQVSQERGHGLFDLETPGPELVEGEVIRKVELQGFCKTVNEACDRLRGGNLH